MRKHQNIDLYETERVGLGIRVLGSGSGRVLSGPGLLGPRILDPYRFLKKFGSVPGRVLSGPGRFGSTCLVPVNTRNIFGSLLCRVGSR